MLQNEFLKPPIVFLLVMLGTWLGTRALSALAFRRPAGAKPVSRKPYACGETVQDNVVHPDYSQFFPFAFFFTILHVVVLMITTVPRVDPAVFVAAAFYVMGAVTGLTILLRK